MSDQNSTTSEARRDDRQKVIWAAKLTTTDDKTYDCSVIDVAFAGTQIKTDIDLALGDEVILTIPEIGDFAASIKWVDDQNKGLYLMGGPDLLLKKFSETSGGEISTKPHEREDD